MSLFEQSNRRFRRLSGERSAERIRMMTFMIFLYVLGLNYSQASGQETSSKVYYAVLTAEASAVPNVTALLAAFTADVQDVHIDDLAVTTECTVLEDSIRCTCKKEHIWSARVCEQDPSCCETSTDCVFHAKSPPICFPSTRVTVNGTLYLPGLVYLDSLGDPHSPRFKRLSEELEAQLKIIYSTLGRFEVLKITTFRRPSVTVDFVMEVNSQVGSAALIEKTTQLQRALNGTFILETAGLVEISLVSPVPYGNRTQITCTPKERIAPDMRWELKKLNRDKQMEAFDVTNGLESRLTTTPLFSSLSLRNATEYWEGQFICSFTVASPGVSILNKARAVLDVALLPRIYIHLETLFPRCVQRSTEKVEVRVRCEIERSSENYTVTWLSEGNQTEVEEGEEEDPSKHNLIYTAVTAATCLAEEVLHLTCAFRNRLDQEKTATFHVDVIYVYSNYCKGVGDWPDVKAGYTGRLRCVGQNGERSRKCSSDGWWQEEISHCVNRDLFNILEDVGNVQKGLGSVDDNSASLFSRLSVSTDNTGHIDTLANVDTFVTILSTMKELNHTFKQTILSDFIQASSNILSVSPEKVWKNPQFNNQSDKTVAMKYLESVEGLIERTDITDSLDRNTSNVQLMSCSTRKSHCRNTVFNVTVSMDNSLSGVVKTAGFLHLAEYLPNSDAKVNQLNSIVVSTTFQSNATNPRVDVQLDFALIETRPRNHHMRCVYWDAAAREWSSAGCVWSGPNDPGHCVCQHLSSFAILMSKKPLHLPFLEEITYAGLAVSIVSLAACLAIEALVWHSISKTKISHLRHTAHVNIAACLLVADCCFLASSFPEKMTENWCQVSVVLKHFCYLAMFFWMLGLSIVLLHQTVFLFHDLSKRSYLSFSFFLGYLCPGLIVGITFISYNNGERGLYYSPETCWLIYVGLMKGSIHSFIVPLGSIVIVNVLCMVVVIMKLLDNSKAAVVKPEDDKTAAKSILRIIVLLTPIFGLTWILGFAVLSIDITVGVIAVIMNYTFTILNAFQGLFILLTTYLGEKQVRAELLRRLTTMHNNTPSTSVSFISDTSLKRK